MRQKTEGTRKKKSKDDSPSVSTPAAASESSKIEEETPI
jgi:hypothetical protein